MNDDDDYKCPDANRSYKMKLLPKLLPDWWISSKDQPPSKEFPILVVTDFCKFPISVEWNDKLNIGGERFFENNMEYRCGLSDILYWMPAPQMPITKQTKE